MSNNKYHNRLLTMEYCDHQELEFRRVFNKMRKCSQDIFSEKADIQNTVLIIIPLYPHIYICMCVYTYRIHIYTHIHKIYMCVLLILTFDL